MIMEGEFIKRFFKLFVSIPLIILLLMSSKVLASEAVSGIEDKIKLNDFLENIKQYSNEYFPELANKQYLEELLNGKVANEDSGIIEKIIKVLTGEFKNNISLIFKIIGIAILCSILKSIQSSFSEKGIGEVAFYTCYLMIVTLIITSFTNIVTLCGETVDKLSDFMNMVVPLIFTLITITGNITAISFMQPVIIGMITVITFLLNKFIIPIIYVATVINIVTNISSYIKLDKLSNVLKKSSLWLMELCLIIFTGILSIEGSLAASVDGMTSKIAKNVVSSSIPVVGKILGDTVDSVLGGVAITKNAIGVIGVIAILAITVGPLIKSLIIMMIFNLSTALIEPIADSRIYKCMNGISESLKIIVGILAIVIFIFLIAITMMLKVSNSALMYK